MGQIEMEKPGASGSLLDGNQHILDALTEDPADRTTLSQWSARLAMSERTLARLVVRETGLTFGRWRQQLHLIVALRHLANDESVQRVSGILGYDSVAAFITMFKKALGKSPTQYFASLRESSNAIDQMQLR